MFVVEAHAGFPWVINGEAKPGSAVSLRPLHPPSQQNRGPRTIVASGKPQPE